MTPDNNKFSTELCKACELSLFAWARGRKKEPSRPSLKAECILNAEFQRIARRDKKAFLRDQGKETEKKKKIEWERLEISSRKLEIPREHFMQRWAQ